MVGGWGVGGLRTAPRDMAWVQEPQNVMLGQISSSPLRTPAAWMAARIAMVPFG